MFLSSPDTLGLYPVELKVAHSGLWDQCGPELHSTFLKHNADKEPVKPARATLEPGGSVGNAWRQLHVGPQPSLFAGAELVGHNAVPECPGFSSSLSFMSFQHHFLGLSTLVAQMRGLWPLLDGQQGPRIMSEDVAFPLTIIKNM